MYMYFTQIFIYFSKPLRLLYSLIIYEIVNFSFFTLYSLLLLSFFLYLKSVPIYVIVHVHVQMYIHHTCTYYCTYTCTCTMHFTAYMYMSMYSLHSLQDCTKFKSEKTGRGPLSEGWRVGPSISIYMYLQYMYMYM